MAGMNPELAAAIISSSRRLGIDPVHLGTAISYETGGKWDPNLWGGKNKNYLGLIQAGPEERAKYGIKEGQTPTEQMQGVENFLRDRGVKPGMGLPDIYSTINAGSPGRYNASDAANGGMPGTVRDKVETQMGPHMENALALLGIGGPVGALAQGPTPSGATLDSVAPAAPVGSLASVGAALNPAAAPGQPAAAPQQDPFMPLQQLAMARPNPGQSQQIAAALAQLYGGGARPMGM